MKLSLFDENMLESIRTNWLNSINDDHEVVLTGYEQLFGMIKEEKAWGELGDRINKPVYQAIIEDDKTWAIVHLVQSKKGSAYWVKLMDIYMSPDIDLSDSELSTEKRLQVFVAALIGIFSMARVSEKTDTLKVYGRTDALIAFLRGIQDILSTTNERIEGITTSIEGRWLVFRSTSSI